MYQSVDFSCLHFIYIFYPVFLCTQSLKGFILIAGTMPPRNPTTRRSSRAPKLKEPEVGEGSSPGAAKQLEFTPRPEPVIKTSTKKVFIQPLAFGDTEASTGTKVDTPTLGRTLQEDQPGGIPRIHPTQ
jgi:hypothetical protein